MVLTTAGGRDLRVSLIWVASPQEVLVQQALVDATPDEIDDFEGRAR